MATRARALCYKCEQKYSQGHVYKNTKLWVLLVFDDKTYDGQGQLRVTEAKELPVNSMELSLNSVVWLMTRDDETQRNH